MSSFTFNLTSETDFTTYFNNILEKCGEDELNFTISKNDGSIIPIKYIGELPFGRGVVIRRFQIIDNPNEFINIPPNPSTSKKLKDFFLLTFNGCPIKETTEPITQDIIEPTTEELKEEEELTEPEEKVSEDNEGTITTFIPNQSEITEDDVAVIEEIGMFHERDIEVWQQEFSDSISIDTISQSLGTYYNELNVKKDAYNIQNNSISFLDLIKKYRDTDIDNNPIRAFKKSTNKFSPYLELIKQNRYDCIPIFPIVLNIAEHYNIPDTFLEKNKITRNINKTNLPNTHFNDILSTIINHVKIYKLYSSGKINYKQYNNILYNGTQITGDDDETINIKPFTQPFTIPEKSNIDYNYFKTDLYHKTKLLHYSLYEDHPINLYSLLFGQSDNKNKLITDIDLSHPDIKTSNLPRMRISNSVPITYEDQYEDTYYNERKMNIKTCTGTGMTDKVIAPNKEDIYYKSIIKAPNEINLTDLTKIKDIDQIKYPTYNGETVIIIGFYIPSLENIKSNKFLPELRNDTQNIKKYPKNFNKSGKKILKLDDDNLEIINNINNFNWENIQADNDYIVLFNKGENKELDKNEFQQVLERIFPNIENIIEQQQNRLDKCINLLEMQEILAEYDIPLNNLNIELANKINMKNNFNNNIESIKKKSDTQRDKLKLLKKYIGTIQSIYHELLLLKWKKLPIDLTISMKQLLSTHPKLTLFMFSNYYIADRIKCINPHDFQNMPVEQLIDDIINWFIKNTPHIEDLSEFYKWFSTQSIDIDDILIRKLFDDYKELFKLDKLLDFKTNGMGQFDQYYLRELQMVWNLNHNYNGGRHLLEIFELIQIIKYQKYISSTLNNYARDEYLNETNADPSTWDNLSDDEKNAYAPSVGLIEKLQVIVNDIYSKYENERKKMNTYVSCDKYRIVKIYSSLENMYRDNKKVIYYDERFDTTTFDVRQFKDFQKNKCAQMSIEECKIKFKVSLGKYYLFDNETELNKKLENIILNIQNSKLQNRRPIQDFEICLVMNNNKKEYYQRMNNFWVPLKNKIEPVQILNTDLLPLSFKEVAFKLKQMNMTGVKNNELEEGCTDIEYENKSLPRQLKELYIEYNSSFSKIRAFRKILDFKNQIDSDRNRLTEHLQEQYGRLSFVLKQDVLSTYVYEDLDEEAETAIYPPNYILERLNEIRKIDDTDIMYTNLKSFIEEYGTDYNINLASKLDKDVVLYDNSTEEDAKIETIKDNKKLYFENSPFNEKQFNPITSTYYFYKDIFTDVNIPIICRHHEELLKTPFTTNENKKNILDFVVKNWGIVSGANHICKNCGEIIRARNFSAMEGFDKDDRSMVFRERVVDDLSIYQFDDDADIEAETSISEELGQSIKDMKIKAFNDVYRLLRAYQDMIGIKLTDKDTKDVLELTLKLNVDEFNTRVTKFNIILQSDKQYTKNIITYKTTYNYLIFVERMVASLIHILNTSDYIMTGTGAERELKSGYIIHSFKDDVKNTIKYFIDKLILLIKSNSKYPLYKATGFLINNEGLYRKLDETSSDSSLFQYINKLYSDIGQEGLVAERRELYNKLSEDKNKKRNELKKYDLWSTFAPPLIYGTEIPDMDTFSSISPSIRISNQLIYKYYNIIKNYQDITVTSNKKDTHIRYMTFIMYDNIQSNYLESLMKYSDDVIRLYDELKNLYRSTMLFISDDKQTIKYIKPNIRGRDLQDYMTVNKALLSDVPIEKHEEIIRTNIEDKWIQFNTIVYLDKDINGTIIGRRRVYRELEDNDYELLSGLYSSRENTDFYDVDIQAYLYDELKKKYNNYPDDLIDFKIRVIMRMNTEPSIDYRSNQSINKITTTYDIVSNEFKQDIIRNARNRIEGLTTEDIEKLLLENEKFSVKEMGYLNAFKSYNELDENDIIREKDEVENIYINNGLKDILNLLEIGNIEQNKFFEQLNIVQNVLIDNQESGLRGLYSELVTKKIKDLRSKIAGTNSDIKLLLSSLGSITYYYNELKDTLYETLKIEGFIDSNVTNQETPFRLNIYENIKSNMVLRNLIKYCEIVLSYLYLYYNEQLKKNKQEENIILSNFNFEGYQKMLNKIVSFENIYSMENTISKVSRINPYCISLLVETMCLTILDKLKEINSVDSQIYLDDLIRQLSIMSVYSNRSSNSSYEIRKILKREENERRKRNFDKLTEEERAVYKASRLTGTGRVIGTDITNMMTDQELLISDLITSQVDKYAPKDGEDDLDEGYAYDQDANDEHGDD
jgi:hypothetical protein